LYKIRTNTLFIGQNQVFVPQCHSTNSLAAELMRKKDFSEGTLFITDHQTAGRGQRGNSWEADPRKNLTFSLLLKPSFLLAAEQFYLTIVVSLALHEFLTSRLGDEVKIKWPNDILVNDRKICGILIENTLTGDTIQHCIVGIGLNVNQTTFSIPSPTSMRLVAHQEFDLAAELGLILEKLESSYLHLRSGKNDSLKQKYLNRLYWLGVRHQFRSEGKVFTGVITGVGENGSLNILHDGREISFDLKEISFVS
jgi:BirA family transcriptional regulator, biotin operon repressor / biotin---[acetyl-CoA-carboxylase] ligase